MKKTDSVSYIFPVYNEEKYLEKRIILFLNDIKKSNLPLSEIILVENGSNDNSWKVCKLLAKNNNKIHAKRINTSSYGLAVKHGMLSSKSDVLVLLNVDFYDIKFISKSLKLIEKYNIVNGSKTHPESIDKRGSLEKLRTKALNLILKKIFRYPGSDTHGIKVLRNNKKLKNALTNSIAKHELFDTELLIKLKDSLTELPVKLKEIRPTRYTSINRLKRTAIDIVRLSLYYNFGNKKPNENIILIADDYGMNNTTNNAILDLFQAKNIDVISVLPNMVSKKELLRLKKITKNKNIAIHINLVREKPISKRSEVKTLVDENGYFHKLPTFIFKLLTRQINFNEIEIEVKKQFSFLKKNGVNISHINSEQHTSLLVPIYSIIKKIAQKNNIKNVRNISDLEYYFSWRINKLIIIKITNFILEKIYNQRIEKNDSVTEIITHPGSNYD